MLPSRQQLTSDHEPACMCHLYRLRIKTHVLTFTMPCIDCFIARHGGSSDLILRRIFVFHCANCWFECWRGRSLSDSQHSHTATSSSCGNKCAHRRRSITDQREVQQGMVATVTQGQHSGCIIPLQGNI